MNPRFSDNKERSERELLGILPLLRDDDWSESLERGDLPVDVKHLRLEKGRAITGDDRLRTSGHA